MFNLFDILQAQAGPGMQTIGQQFGLTPEQSRSAMNALLPALAAGLQRSAASDPMGFGRMLGMAGANPFLGGPPQAPAQTDFFGQLFGSPALSQAVLQQASSASGIGQQALRQMLPVMAGMVVAGIVHVLINQPPPQPAPAPIRRQPPPPPPSPESSGFPVAAFWNDWIDQFVGSPDPKMAAPTAVAPATRETVVPPKLPDPVTASQDKEPGKTEEAPFEAFQQIFQTGVQVQEQNARAMQDIFDAFWSKPAEAPAASEPLASAVEHSPETSHSGAAAADTGSETTPTGRKPPARRKGK